MAARMLCNLLNEPGPEQPQRQLLRNAGSASFFPTLRKEQSKAEGLAASLTAAG